jgi:soluble lytic murein transglycosylase
MAARAWLFCITTCWLLVGTLLDTQPARAADASYWFSAVRAYAEGRYEDVLAALELAPPAPELAYLKARTLAELSKYAAALDAFSEAPAAFPAAVKQDFAQLRAEWAAQAGDCKRLEEWSDALASKRATRLVAECAFFAGDYAKAVDGLASATDTAGRALFLRALIANQDPRAPEVARKLWIEAPSHDDAETWRSLVEGPERPPLTFDERMQRAEAWLEARRVTEALAELEPIAEPKDRAQRAQLWHVRGLAYFRTRRTYPEASRAFEKASKLGGTTEAYDAFHTVRSRSRAGDDRSAIAGYEAFAKRYPKSKFAGDALYLAAWLRGREGMKSAASALEAFIRSDAAREQPGLRRDAYWDLAWLALEAGDGTTAERWLARAPESHDAMERARVSYWRARALAMEGRHDAAKAQYRATLLVNPLDWYAQLSARRLQALGEPAPSPFAGEATDLQTKALQAPDDVLFYRRLGLEEDAGRAAERWADSLGDNLARARAYALAECAVQSHSAAVPFLGRVFRGPVTAETAWLWQAAFPRPYLSLVERETRRNELPLALFYGHMQVESRYRPRVVSGADAIGLMQLLPATASKVAEGTGIEATRTTLRRPYVNVALGAAYLSGLLKRYERQFPAAIAAYNAGGHRIDGWLKAKTPVDLDRWVERISIAQTRNYVRRVVTAWSRYHYLESPSDPWGIELPEQMRRID